MTKHTVFVIQEKQSSLDEVVGALKGASFEIVGTALNGEEGVEEIARLKPDLLITEIILSGIDGLAVMSAVREQSLNTKIMALSAFVGESVVKKAIKHGALYYMTKPFSSKLLCERLEELMETEAKVEYENKIADSHLRKRNSLEEKISKIFISVGIPPHIKGYSYLREGVKLAISNPDIINSITKKLYPTIGERYETTASKVERAIRHAIEVAWNRGRIDIINSIFGVRAYVGSEKPTNGEFIALIADKMLLEGA